jgi:hypothetical protein
MRQRVDTHRHHQRTFDYRKVTQTHWLQSVAPHRTGATAGGFAGVEVMNRLDHTGLEELEPQIISTEDFAKFIRSKIDLYTRVAKAANLPKL